MSRSTVLTGSSLRESAARCRWVPLLGQKRLLGCRAYVAQTETAARSREEGLLGQKRLLVPGKKVCSDRNGCSFRGRRFARTETAVRFRAAGCSDNNGQSNRVPQTETAGAPAAPTKWVGFSRAIQPFWSEQRVAGAGATVFVGATGARATVCVCAAGWGCCNSLFRPSRSAGAWTRRSRLPSSAVDGGVGRTGVRVAPGRGWQSGAAPFRRLLTSS